MSRKCDLVGDMTALLLVAAPIHDALERDEVLVLRGLKMLIKSNLMMKITNVMKTG